MSLCRYDKVFKSWANYCRRKIFYIFDTGSSFFLAKARSLLPKVDKLKVTLQTNEGRLVFITETWLNENVDDSAVQNIGFSWVRRDRLTRIGGGVCAYINEHILLKF